MLHQDDGVRLDSIALGNRNPDRLYDVGEFDRTVSMAVHLLHHNELFESTQPRRNRKDRTTAGHEHRIAVLHR